MSARDDADIETAFTRAETREGRLGIQAMLTGDACDACATPENGSVVVVITIGDDVRFRLCPIHFNVLRGVLERLVPVREI